MNSNEKPQTAEDILAMAGENKENYWSNDGSKKWTSPLGTIHEGADWKACPNGCDFFAFFKHRKQAMDYVKENAK